MKSLSRGCIDKDKLPVERCDRAARPSVKAIAGPLPELRFCPTGGISPRTAPDYLALPNVGCVGGSWLAPASLLAAGDWAKVEELAREAAALR